MAEIRQFYGVKLLSSQSEDGGSLILQTIRKCLSEYTTVDVENVPRGLDTRLKTVLT